MEFGRAPPEETPTQQAAHLPRCRLDQEQGASSGVAAESSAPGLQGALRLLLAISLIAPKERPWFSAAAPHPEPRLSHELGRA